MKGFAFDLGGKVAVVTGASRGLGSAIAAELARLGADVTIAGRTKSDLETVAASIKDATGREPLIAAVDLRGPDAPADVVAQTLARFGRLDILVNNAGATKRGPFLELSDDDMLDGFALKFHATVRFCKAAWPQLRENKGSIVNIAGIGAHTPTAEFTIGGSVNSALIHFTKAIADQGLVDGVRANLVNPGHIATDRLTMRVRKHAQELGLTYEEAAAHKLQEMGLTRFGDPADIAQMVAFLCSPFAGYVHGSTIDVDGGATRGI